MDCRIELIFVPVTDVDRAIEFYVEKLGFALDMQARVSEPEVRAGDATDVRVLHRLRRRHH